MAEPPASGRMAVERLANDVRAAILARAAVIAQATGLIVVEAHPRGAGFDIKLKVVL